MGQMQASGDGEHIGSEDVVEIINREGRSDFLLVCEHASNFIPHKYNALGLSGGSLTSHIAWDPGALAVATHLSELLDAPLVAAKISRLVYDCNRPTSVTSSIPQKSDAQVIPGNQNLSHAERQVRIEQVYEPFSRVLAETVAQRSAGSVLPVLVTIHSFTPVFQGESRDVEIGVLHDTDARLADGLLSVGAHSDFNVQRNAPYGPSDGVTHTLVAHALPRDLLNVMIEIRNDLIASEAAQKEMAHWLADRLIAALERQKTELTAERTAS